MAPPNNRAKRFLLNKKDLAIILGQRSAVQQELHWHDEHRNLVWMSIELVAVIADYFKILKANYPKSKT